MSGSVTAVVATPVRRRLGSLGADSVLAMRGVPEAADWADVLATAAGEAEPWVLLVEGTRDGRFVASVVAARHGWGLTGDAVGLEIDESARLVAWKPAFGGRLEGAHSHEFVCSDGHRSSRCAEAPLESDVA